MNFPDIPDESDPALMEWLATEINGELIDLLHSFRARLSGCSVEQPSEDIDLDYVEAGHLAPFNELFDCVREARIVFFDDADLIAYYFSLMTSNVWLHHCHYLSEHATYHR